MPIPQLPLVIRFGATGLLNTVFGYAAFTLLILAGAGSGLALIGATVAGVAFNFQTSRRLVFRSNGRSFRFVLVYGVVLGLNWLALQGLLLAGFSDLAGQGVLALPLAAVSFIGQRMFVFSDPTPSRTTCMPVIPSASHLHHRQHWLLRDRFLWVQWISASWDQPRQVWILGRKEITPEQAERRGWRYTGPALSPRDL